MLWSRADGSRDVAHARGAVRGCRAARSRRSLPESSTPLAKALPVLQSIGSPLSLWARYFVVLDWSQQGRIGGVVSPSSIAFRLRSGSTNTTRCRERSDNRRGQIFGRQGNQEGAIRERAGRDSRVRTGVDVDQLSLMHSLVAEVFRFLATHRTRGGITANRSNDLRRHAELSLSASRARPGRLDGDIREGQFDAANAFQRQVVENGREWQRASGTATGSSSTRATFRDRPVDDADASIRDARAMVASVTDAAFRDRIELELLEVEGEVFGNRDPAAGLPVLTGAVERFDEAGLCRPPRQPAAVAGPPALRAPATWLPPKQTGTAPSCHSKRERTMVSADSLRLAQAGSLRAHQRRNGVLARSTHGRPAAESLAPLERGRARTLVEDALSTSCRRSSSSEAFSSDSTIRPR